jgi:hypothetical protein
MIGKRKERINIVYSLFLHYLSLKLTNTPRMKKIYFAQALVIFLFIQISVALNAQNCWSPVGQGVGQSSADALAIMTPFNGSLIAGGHFAKVGSVTANNIASWNGTTWTPLGTGINELPVGNYYYDVVALAVYNNELYAAGSFDTAGNMPANNIAKWNGASWAPVGGGVKGYVVSGVDTAQARIDAMTVYNGELYVAGNFYSAGGVVVNNIAKWNGSNWSAVGTGIGTNSGNTLTALTTWNGLLYAGGHFSHAGSLPATNIASWNGSTWAALGAGLEPDTVFGIGVKAFTVYNGGLYTGASHLDQSYNEVFSISKWNGTSWSDFLGGPDTGVYYTGNLLSLYPFNGDLIAEGTFANIANVSNAGGIALWNGNTWTAFGSNNDSAGYMTATTYNAHLYVGGIFGSIGGINALNGAEYTCATEDGVEQISAGTKMHIYPNPTGGLINVSMESITAGSWLQIYGLHGERVLQVKLVNGKNEIDLTGASKGAYLYRIAGESGESFGAGTFIVQ